MKALQEKATILCINVKATILCIYVKATILCINVKPAFFIAALSKNTMMAYKIHQSCLKCPSIYDQHNFLLLLMHRIVPL